MPITEERLRVIESNQWGEDVPTLVAELRGARARLAVLDAGLAAPALSVVVHENTFMGDHGEFVQRAQEVGDGETVAELAGRLLGERGMFQPARYDNFIVIRMVEPKPDVDVSEVLL